VRARRHTRFRRDSLRLEKLWEIICSYRKEFGLVIFVDTVLLAKEMDEYFKAGKHARAMDVVHDYADQQHAAKIMMSFDPDRERPFVSHKIWALFFVIRQIYGRAALLIETSYRDRKYNDWRHDSGFDQILSSVLPATAVDSIKQRSMGGLMTAIDHMEANFLAEAGLHKQP
jgi:hypothetical protein